MVDNGIIEFKTKLDINHIINHTANFFKREFLETEKDKVFLRNIKKRNYEYINFLSISEYRLKTKIVISFSYSRFFSNDNYYVCDTEKKVSQVHLHLMQLLQALTGVPDVKKKISLMGLDICNQIKTNFKDKYNTINLLAKILGEEQTTLYYSINAEGRKELQGISLFEDRRAKKEQKTFFKVYNKAKERLDTNKFEVGQSETIRAELTLRKYHLEKLGITSIDAVKKNVLDEVVKKVLVLQIKKKLETVIKKDLEKLIEIVNDKPFSQQDFLKYEHLIFDIEFLKYLFSPEISGMPRATGFYHKKLILEQLNDLEKKGEIVKKYSGNIKDLEKILDKLFKTKVKIKATAKGIDVTWLE